MHDIKKEKDTINGVFYITGEYKITDGQLEKDKFNFELPFDIALGSNYDLDTLDVDVDDFRYEQISRNELKVNIDLYINGEVEEEPANEVPELERVEITENLDLLDDIPDNKENPDTTNVEEPLASKFW